MITLSGLREYLSERRQASVAEMTLHFDASPDAVRGALSHWLAKGRARRLDPREDLLRLRLRLQGRGGLRMAVRRSATLRDKKKGVSSPHPRILKGRMTARKSTRPFCREQERSPGKNANPCLLGGLPLHKG